MTDYNQLDQAQTQKEIGRLIKDSIKKVQEREQVSPISTTSTPSQPQELPFADKGEDKERLALIPYPIITTLSKLTNIYETRLFGWVLAKAQSVLKLYNKDLSAINVQHALDVTRVTIPARLLLGEGDKNYREVVKAFELADKKIEYEREDRLYHLNIIAFPELVKDGRKSLVTFVIHSQIWHALLDFSKGYRTFSITTFMSLKSRFSVIFYLIITNQRQPKTYLLSTLRQLTGTDKLHAYDRTGNFMMRVVDVAQRELSEKAPWCFDYSLNQSGRSHRITEIVIAPRLNQAYNQPTTGETRHTAAVLRIGLEDEVMRYLGDHYGMTPKEVERVEPLLMRLGGKEKQLERLSEVRNYILKRRIRNKGGYLYTALKSDQ